MSACLIQGSADWLALRKTKITASDASVIMGVNPWVSPLKLYNEKMGLSEPREKTFAMQRGNDLEEPARQCFEKKTGLTVFPRVVFHPENDWMMASLDGISLNEKHIVEIKCPLKFSLNIPDHYFAQIQHQLACTELDMCYYFVFDGTDGQFVEVNRDQQYIESLIKKENEFYQCIVNKTSPIINPDYVMRSDDFWNENAKNWKQVNDQIAQLEKKEKELRETLIQTSGGSSSQGAGIKLSKILRKGNVNYKNISELVGVDLEQYRKNDIETWRIDCV